MQLSTHMQVRLIGASQEVMPERYEIRMADPTDPAERKQAEPHPASSHRTPGELARDEAGPAGPAPQRRETMPAAPKQGRHKEDDHIRDAVQRSAHRAKSLAQPQNRPSRDSRK